jgi:hypothetical protein
VETVLALAAGLGLVFLGRKLFWFFVGVAGFLAGWYLAHEYLPPEQGTLVVVTAVAAGLIGILLALLLQKVAVLVGGFLAGGYALLTLAPGLGPLGAVHPAIPFILGGILGAILMRFVFDTGLIILSSLAGAALILEVLHVKDPFHLPLLIGIAVIGTIVQWRGRGSGGKKDRPPEGRREEA